MKISSTFYITGPQASSPVKTCCDGRGQDMLRYDPEKKNTYEHILPCLSL
jgi:hypothetical protein